MVKEKPPSQPCIENIPYINFNEGIIAIMWDKKKGKAKYDKGNEVLWLGPYIVQNNSENGIYYLSAMHGRRMSFLVDGSLLQPYIKVN
jgi:hypothetical protein